MGMVKKPFLFALLARFLCSPILHYADSLWTKKIMAEQYFAFRTTTLICFRIVWGYKEIFLLIMILVSFYVTE